MRRSLLRRAAGSLAAVLTAAGAIAVPTAGAVFPGANGKIAVTTEAQLPCGDCDPVGERAWLLSRGGRRVSLPGRTVSFSPSGTRIAYDHFGHSLLETGVTIAHADGSKRRLLRRQSAAPAWAPRNGLLAYAPFSGGLVVSSADGQKRWRLRYSASSFGDFAWSPTGRELAVVHGDSLRVFGFRGRHQRTVVPSSQTPPGPHGEPPITEPLEGVAWSSSGWLSYLRRGELVVIRPNGSESRTLLTDACCREGLQTYLDYSWSADGKRIAFVREDALWVMRVPDGTPRLLLPADKMGVAPQWSPDGRLIAYVRGARPAGHRLLTVPASGGEPRTFATFNDRNAGNEYVVDIDWQARPRR